MADRIVSMLASATEIVAVLGAEDRLIGISHECDYPERILDRPRVSTPRFDAAGMESDEIDRAVRNAMLEHGSVYRIDGDVLAELDPDLILTQAVCEVCAVPTPGVQELVSQRGIGADVLSLDAHTIDEILGTVLQVGRAIGVEDRAREVVAGLRARLDGVDRAVADANRPGALAIEWLAPVFTPGHWVPEMVERAGAVNLAGDTGSPSREVAWESLAGLDPDVLLVMPCGYGLDESRAEADRHAERLHALAPRAIARGNAYVLDGSSFFNRSGPRVVRGVEILAGTFHSDRWPAPAAQEAARWEG